MCHRIKGQNMVVQRIPIWKDGKVIAVFGQVMFKDIKDVTKLANLPSREILLSQVLSAFQSPMRGMVNVLSGPMRGLVTVLKARADHLAPAES